MNATEKKHTIKLAIWTWTWVGTLAIATLGPQLVWETPVITYLALLINLVNGVGMILANRNYFLQLDELQRMIQLESLAVSLGLTVVVGLLYSLLDIHNLIKGDAEIGLLVGFVGVTYLMALLINRKRFE